MGNLPRGPPNEWRRLTGNSKNSDENFIPTNRDVRNEHYAATTSGS
jgi:hypothetical protein